jgi:hypothetical protein
MCVRSEIRTGLKKWPVLTITTLEFVRAVQAHSFSREDNHGISKHMRIARGKRSDFAIRDPRNGKTRDGAMSTTMAMPNEINCGPVYGMAMRTIRK